MKTIAIAALASVALVGVALLAFMAWITSDSTTCGASFERRADAVRAAIRARGASFNDVFVEGPEPDSRKPTSRGARAIFASFDDGETGEDAAALQAAFREIVRTERGRFPGCDERSRLD